MASSPIKLFFLALIVSSSVLAQADKSDSAQAQVQLWQSVKRQLSGPAEQPSVLAVTLSNSTTPEVTLHFKDAHWKDAHLNGPLMRGSQLSFAQRCAQFQCL